ncbi:MAG: hypothetical protein ABW128_11295 [Rhizorhabdus sp.]
MRGSAEMAAVISPADYIRLRRHAALLTIADLALRLVGAADRAETVAETLRLAERPGATIGNDRLVDLLARAMPLTFDAAVYRQLRDEPADRHPTLCGECACSGWLRCECDDGQDCRIGEGGLCSACEQHAASSALDRRAA